MIQLIELKLIENSNKIEWNFWFLLIAVLSLIAAVLIPFIQKKYEERKAKFGFHLYVKKHLGIVWNISTYDKVGYKQPASSNEMDDLELSFDIFILRFANDYVKNKNTIHPLFAFGILFNLQNMLFTISRIQQMLREIDIKHLGEKTLEFGDKLSKKEHLKLAGLFLLFQHYDSITKFHEKFGALKSIKREFKNGEWIGLIVEQSVLKNQKLILDDLKYLTENEISINEIININKLLIQELKLYFDYDKLMKKKNSKLHS
jgi:hypothetical protein